MSASSVPATLERAVADRLGERVVVVGIGNPLRGDDAAGCAVVRGLRDVPGITVVDSEDVPERDLLRIADGHPDTVLLVDAVDMGAPPGSVALLEPEDLAVYAPTTHRVPLALLAGVLECACGADVLVLALQPGQLAPGAPLGRDVAESVAAVVEVIRGSVADATAGREVRAC